MELVKVNVFRYVAFWIIIVIIFPAFLLWSVFAIPFMGDDVDVGFAYCKRLAQRKRA